MADKTKAELQLELEEARKRIEEQEKQLQAQAHAIEELQIGDEGWLVTTPNPSYDGKRAGVHFYNGQAFIRKGQSISAFEVKPMKETAMDKMKYSQAEKDAIREREAVPSAERAIEYFEQELGYKVIEVNGNIAELELAVDERARQRAELDKELARADATKNMIKPGYMGEE